MPVFCSQYKTVYELSFFLLIIIQLLLGSDCHQELSCEEFSIQILTKVQALVTGGSQSAGQGSRGRVLLSVWSKDQCLGRPVIGKNGILHTQPDTPDLEAGQWIQRLGPSGKASRKSSQGGWFRYPRKRPGLRGERQGLSVGSLDAG